MEGFGKSKYTGDSFFKKYKIKEGSNVYRVLPAMKSLAETGEWHLYHKIHYGYNGVNRKDPSKTWARPFACIEKKDRRSDMLLVECPECVNISAKEQAKVDTIARLKAEGKTEEQIVKFVEPLTDWLKSHNRDSKHYLNVVNEAGEFGYLLISNRTYNSLQTTFKGIVNDERVDPTDLNEGVWVNIKRTGIGLTTPDTVEVIYDNQNFNGVKAKVLKLAPLSEAQCRQALTQCPDLAKDLVTYISEDQIKMLVACSGAPDEVDSIMTLSQPTENTVSAKVAAVATVEPVRVVMAPVNVETKTIVPTPVTHIAGIAVQPLSRPVEDEEAALRAQLEAIQARKAQKQQETAVAVAAPTGTVAAKGQDPLKMSDEEFLSMFKS